MAKIKIILADLDEQYLAPLEMKFLEALDDELELEIITEKGYFDDFFMRAQSADILVVDEELYSSDLHRHNISNIFVLAEQPEDEEDNSYDVTRLFKYTSIKEIYNQVISASGVSADGKFAKAKETIVVLVSSAAGGVGKTTLALGLCACFAKNFRKVLYIDAERINSFQYMLSNQAPIPNNMCQEFSKEGTDIFQRIKPVIRNEKFDYLPAFGATISSLNIKSTVYGQIIDSVKMTREYDLIIVDTDSVFDETKADMIMQADKVIFVTKQTEYSVYAMNMLLKNINYSNAEKFYFVCNDFCDDRENALLNSEMKPSFVVSEYVSHMMVEDITHINEMGDIADIQKLALMLT